MNDQAYALNNQSLVESDVSCHLKMFEINLDPDNENVPAVAEEEELQVELRRTIRTPAVS